ncbi:ATP synthase F0 subunit B [Chroococcidiopsis cubana CCALA 043]|nr:F0F1 ATP synthase subunit B [Chroococcidiopsidales cyanobacterium LEGE 13417]PSB50841.1 ATP synthase F0 subunit B [Chroococcidiopsis cubana CCALA 043]PSM50554.1 ATP synthase F0 subunit B [Chroococcidiopsis sp. CCALA 051]
MGMMGSFIWLVTQGSPLLAEAAEAEAEAGGFGLNFDILETNLINLAILVGVLVYFGSKVVGKTLSDRRERIETEIVAAENRAKEAAAALQKQQQRLTEAQAEAERIRQSATTNAQQAKEQILAQVGIDIQRLKETATQDLNTARERAIAQLRASVVAMALQKVESQLESGLDENIQQQTIDRSIALLGGSK